MLFLPLLASLLEWFDIFTFSFMTFNSPPMAPLSKSAKFGKGQLCIRWKLLHIVLKDLEIFSKKIDWLSSNFSWHMQFEIREKGRRTIREIL